jgi:hypothetical protein
MEEAARGTARVPDHGERLLVYGAGRVQVGSLWHTRAPAAAVPTTTKTEVKARPAEAEPRAISVLFGSRRR